MFSFKKEEQVSEDYIDRQFYDFFILRQFGLNETNIRFQSDEVQAVRFVNINELNRMREENLLVNRDECYDVLTEYLYRM